MSLKPSYTVLCIFSKTISILLVRSKIHNKQNQIIEYKSTYLNRFNVRFKKTKNPTRASYMYECNASKCKMHTYYHMYKVSNKGQVHVCM